MANDRKSGHNKLASKITSQRKTPPGSPKRKKDIPERASVRLEQHESGSFVQMLTDKGVVDYFDNKKLRIRFREAGMRGKKPMLQYVVQKVTYPFIFLLVGAIVSFLLELFKDSNTGYLTTIGASVFGFYFPNIALSNARTKRQVELTLNFPDALDLLLICVESGMSVEQALMKVKDEVAKTSRLLSDELAITTAELSYLPDRRQAYVNLGMRGGIDSIKSTATALVQAEKFGTSIAETLRVIAQEVREERMNRAETKAAALPPLLTVPMILFFLPVLLVVIITPAILNYYFN